jgi:protein ImuB
MFACIHWPVDPAITHNARKSGLTTLSQGSPPVHTSPLRELADAFSPWVEQVAPDTVLFSLDGLHRIYGDARSTAKALAVRAPGASIAIASLPDTAVLAARNLPGVVIIEPGEEIHYLGPLPLDCLPLDPSIWKILDRWGLRTFEDLACLPENGLHDRLGEAGVRLQTVARGALGRPLKPFVEETIYEQRIELDDALELLEPILFLLARFLNDLCASLKSQSLAAGELHLTMNRTQRILRLPFPTRDVKFLLKQLQHNLESDLPGEPVSILHLRVIPTAMRFLQHDLFTLPAPEPERLESTLQKIRAMVGPKNVKIPEIRNTHRPGWGPSESNLAFRHFRPPLDAQVETKHLRASGIQGTIEEISGPWRTSGDWWRPDPWDRDEFDLSLSDGALYRLNFNRQSQKWQLEGAYD